MSKTENLSVAVYQTFNPVIDRDIPDIISWEEFIAEALYLPHEYERVKAILLTGRRWIMGSRRVVFMVMSHTITAEYMANAYRASREFNTERKPR